MNKIFVVALVLALMSALVGVSYAEQEVVKGSPQDVKPLQKVEKSTKEGKEYVVEAWGRAGPVYPNYGSIYRRISYGGYFYIRPVQVQVSLEIPSPYNQKFSEGADKGYIWTGSFDARVTTISGNLNGALIDYRAK